MCSHSVGIRKVILNILFELVCFVSSDYSLYTLYGVQVVLFSGGIYCPVFLKEK